MSAVCDNSERKKNRGNQDLSSISQDASFNPTLQKKSTLFWYVLIISIGFLILYVFNVVGVVDAGKSFVSESKNVVSRNKALSIYLKSIFNPNATYVNQFANGSLFEDLPYLYDSQFNYTTFLGDVIAENKYYLFNTQIPSTLQRLVSNPLSYSTNTVDITPLTSADYYREMTANYLGVVREYHNKFTGAISVWK